MTKTSDKIDLQEIVTPIGYLASKLSDKSSLVIINTLYNGLENNDNFTPDTYRGIFFYINNTLLKQDIHMDFNKLRSNLKYDVMMGSMSKLVPGESLIFRFDYPKTNDEIKKSIEFVPVDYKVMQVNFYGTINGDIDTVKERLDKIGHRMG